MNALPDMSWIILLYKILIIIGGCVTQLQFLLRTAAKSFETTNTQIDEKPRALGVDPH